MPTFVVETYLARGSRGTLEIAVNRIRRAIPPLPADAAVRYLRSVFIPEDETCFHVIEAPTIEAVAHLVDRAHLAAERIVKAEALDSRPGD